MEFVAFLLIFTPFVLLEPAYVNIFCLIPVKDSVLFLVNDRNSNKILK